MRVPYYLADLRMDPKLENLPIWVVVEITVPFWVPIIYGTYYLGYPTRDPNCDNYPYRGVHMYNNLGFIVVLV